MYRFRLRFFTYFPGKLKSESNRLEFSSTSNNDLVLTAPKEQSIGQSTEFVLSMSGFETKNEALETGLSAKDCLLILGAKWHLGVDAGNDMPEGRWGETIKAEIAQKHKARLIENVHGLSVFPDDLPPVTMSVEGRGVIDPKTIQEFGIELLSLIDRGIKLSPKNQLSLELYNSSHHEKSIRSKFLTLFSAVESLVELEERQDDAQQLVNSLKKVVAESLIDQSKKNSIRGTLNKLSKISTRQGLKQLSQKFLHDHYYAEISAEDFIEKCCNIRNQLVHHGCTSEDINLPLIYSQLDFRYQDVVDEIGAIRLVKLQRK